MKPLRAFPGRRVDGAHWGGRGGEGGRDGEPGTGGLAEKGRRAGGLVRQKHAGAGFLFS